MHGGGFKLQMPRLQMHSSCPYKNTTLKCAKVLPGATFYSAFAFAGPLRNQNSQSLHCLPVSDWVCAERAERSEASEAADFCDAPADIVTYKRHAPTRSGL